MIFINVISSFYSSIHLYLSKKLNFKFYAEKFSAFIGKFKKKNRLDSLRFFRIFWVYEEKEFHIWKQLLAISHRKSIRKRWVRQKEILLEIWNNLLQIHQNCIFLPQRHPDLWNEWSCWRRTDVLRNSNSEDFRLPVMSVDSIQWIKTLENFLRTWS